MKFFLQMLTATMALSAALSSPVQPEPRKFVYQVGAPSVRRYPVFPDRHLELDQSQVLKLAAEKNKDIKNEIEKPDVMNTRKPMTTHTEGMENAEGENSTDSWMPVDLDLTTASSRPLTTSAPLTNTTFEEASSPSDFFSFTPQPAGSFRHFNVNTAEGDNSVFPVEPTGVFPEEPTKVFPLGPEGAQDGGFFEAREHEVDTHFGVFTEGPEESTDMAVTTDLPRHSFMGEEEKMADVTISPAEFSELSENRTDVPLLDETATDSAWDEATQEIFTTEEIDKFL